MIGWAKLRIMLKIELASALFNLSQRHLIKPRLLLIRRATLIFVPLELLWLGSLSDLQTVIFRIDHSFNCCEFPGLVCFTLHV